MREIALSIAIALGCSSKSDPGVAANDTGTIDSADAPVVGSEPLRMVDNLERPLSGARVQVLAEDGAVLADGTSGADGALTLNNFKFNEKLVTIVAWLNNKYSVEVLHAINRAGLDKLDAVNKIPPGQPFKLFLYSNPSFNPKLSGTVTGGTEGSFLIVAGETTTTAFINAGTTYSVRSTASTAGKLVVTELSTFGVATTLDQTYRQFVQFDVPAITADTKLNFDLTKGLKLTSKKATGKAEITGGKDGPLGGESKALAFVSAANPWVFAGGITKAQPNADGSAFDYELEYAEPTLAAKDPFHVFRIVRADDSFSERLVLGAPTDGEVLKDFPLPLPITFTKIGLADEISFEGAPAGAFRFIQGTKPNQDLVLRVGLSLLYTAPTFKLPKLPDEALALLPPSMQSRLVVLVDPIGKSFAGGSSQSRAFSLTR